MDSTPDNPRQVFFGAWITLEDEKGKEYIYRIVGPDEFDSQKDYISMDSPMARALLKKAVDEEVIVQTPKGAIHYWITDVRYQAQHPD